MGGMEMLMSSFFNQAWNVPSEWLSFLVNFPRLSALALLKCGELSECPGRVERLFWSLKWLR